MNQQSIIFAIGLGHALAKKAADKAERENPTWQDQALTYLREYAQDHSEFQSLHVRLYAENRGLPPAPDSRAFGHVMKLGQKLKIIQATGRYEATDHKASHGRAQMCWMSLVFKDPPSPGAEFDYCSRY